MARAGRSPGGSAGRRAGRPRGHPVLSSPCSARAPLSPGASSFLLLRLSPMRCDKKLCFCPHMLCSQDVVKYRELRKSLMFWKVLAMPRGVILSGVGFRTRSVLPCVLPRYPFSSSLPVGSWRRWLLALKLIWPLVGSYTPVMQLKAVVFPCPVGANESHYLALG